MPINKDRFEELGDDGGEESPTPGTNAAKILNFLRNHPAKAFTQSEIAAETDVKSGSVGPTLVRLRERGRVDHRGNYWRVSDHDETVSAATGHAAAALAVRETDGELPQMDEWQNHAVDPREHRDESKQ
jgi:predicted transcriptional regulator